MAKLDEQLENNRKKERQRNMLGAILGWSVIALVALYGIVTGLQR